MKRNGCLHIVWGLLAVAFPIGCEAESAPGANGAEGPGSSTGSTPSSTLSATTDATGGDTDPTRGDDSMSESDTEDSGTDTLAITCDGQCVELAPKGWQGPVARIDLNVPADESSCGGVFPELARMGFSSVSEPRSECDCSCGTPQGGACDPTIGVEVYDAECTATGAGGSCVSTNANFNGCSNLDDTLFAGPDLYVDDDRYGVRLVVEAPAVAASPSCTPVSTVALEPAIAGDFVALCAAKPTALDCELGAVCVPVATNPFVDGLCIWAEGDLECPDETYAAKTLLYDGLADTRACSECTCGSAQSVSCAGEVEVVVSYSNGGLVVDPPESFAADGTCTTRVSPNATPLNGANFTVDYDAPSPTASGCPSGGGELGGAVTTLGVRTVCCAA